ncbi:MAG: hypothetical protein LBR07_09875 [Puniceicoccales bacterium]|jgi:hypothetical protein|nr:hypothetical protein [Puniceicoccales bacterium]
MSPALFATIAAASQTDAAARPAGGSGFFADLAEMWSKTDTAGQFFAAIGIVAGVITLVLLLMTVFGLDHGNLEAPDTAGDGDGSLFSTRTVSAFFLGFGGVGSLVYERTASVVAASGAGLLAGVALLWAIYQTGRRLMRLQSDGTVRYADAVGAAGKVYITIPPARAPGGQAEITFSNRNEILDAVSDSAAPIAAGAPVRVKALLADRLLLVEPL